MDFTNEQLNSLMADVTEAFSAELAKAEKGIKLAKSEDFPKKDESKEKDEKKDAEDKGDSKKPIEEEKPEDKGIKDQDQQADDKAGDKDQAQPENKEVQADGEGHDYDEEDQDHLHKMYSSMKKAELKVHHDIIRKCMDSMGLAKCEDGLSKAELEDAAKDAEGYRPNGGPSDGEAAKAKTPAVSDEQAMNKSESLDEISLLKSELEAVKAKSAEEKKNLETALQNFLTKFVEKTAPAGKAVMSLDVIAKTENGQNEKPLSKSEIHEKLMVKAKDMSLSNSDREAINSYCVTKNVEKIRHLL